jgi:hypothetical protein
LSRRANHPNPILLAIEIDHFLNGFAANRAKDIDGVQVVHQTIYPWPVNAF